MLLKEAIYERHSTRSYAAKQVPGPAIRKVLEAGSLAPSAKNCQPWRFSVLTDEQKFFCSDLMARSEENAAVKSTVLQSAKIIRSAPVAIAVFTPKERTSGKSIFLSLGACLENMSLTATDLGLGSLIVCDTQSAQRELETYLRSDDELVAIFLLGYEKKPAVRKKKKPLATLVRGLSDCCGEDVIDDLPEAKIGDAPFLFISYSHRDAKLVLTDIVELKKHGVRLWYDRSIIYGEEWDRKALGVLLKPNCCGVLAYLSKNSAASSSVCLELKTASEKFKGQKAKMIGIHIGDKPLSFYLGASSQCDRILKAIFSDKDKYIAHSPLAGDFSDIPEIIGEAERLGAVDESGVYDDFKYRKAEDGIEIIQYRGTSRKVVVPSTICGSPVTSIGKNAMRGSERIREIVLPATVKRVEEGAFFDLSALEKIFLPNSIEHLGVAAFRGCTALQTVSLPSGLKKLEEALFRGCTSLRECTVPYGVEELGEAVFRECASLKKAVLPKTVKRMTEGGFYGCTSLEVLEIPYDIEGLEAGSFLTCPLLNVDVAGFRFRNGKPIVNIPH